MAAHASPSGNPLGATAFAFAGGLALGLGSYYVLNRPAFAPASKVSRATKDKLSKDKNVSAAASSKSIAPAAAAPTATAIAQAPEQEQEQEKEKKPLSESLDAVDAKGAGPTAPVVSSSDKFASANVQTGPGGVSQHGPLQGASVPPGAAQAQAQAEKEKDLASKNAIVGVTGTPAETFDTFPRSRHVQARINLSQSLSPLSSSSSSDPVVSAGEAPVWLAGLPHSAGAQASTANGVLERLTYERSDAVFVYESGANAGGLGAWIEAQAQPQSHSGAAGAGAGKAHNDRADAAGAAHARRPAVFSLQTRAGAGTALLGYLHPSSSSSSSAQGSNGKVVSALTDAHGLLSMAPALAFAPRSADGAADRIVLQVNTAVQAPALSPSSPNQGEGEGEGGDLSLQVYNDTSAVLRAAAAITSSEEEAGGFTVVFSAERQEIVDVASASLRARHGHVLHAFDGAFSGREQLSGLAVPASATSTTTTTTTGGSVAAELARAGLAHFRYTGPAAPKTLLVLPNDSSAASARAVYARAALGEREKESVGVLAVRVLRPWDEAALLAAIPQSVRALVVLEQSASASASASPTSSLSAAGLSSAGGSGGGGGVEAGVLYQDVVASVLYASSTGGRRMHVKPLALPTGARPTAHEWRALFAALAAPSPSAGASLSWESVRSSAAKAAESEAITHAQLLGAGGKLATIYETDGSASSYVSRLVSRLFNERGVPLDASARVLERFDNFKAGGVVRADLLLGPAAAADATASSGKGNAGAAQTPVDLAADSLGPELLLIGEPAALLKALNPFAHVRAGATVLVNVPGWEASEFAAKLRAEDKKALAAKNVRLYTIDAAAVVDAIEQATASATAGGKSKAPELHREVAAAVLLVAFLRLALDLSGAGAVRVLERLLGAAPLGSGGVAQLVEQTERALRLVGFSNAEWAASEDPETDAAAAAGATRATRPTFNGFSRGLGADVLAVEPQPVTGTWALPAWQALFPEAYGLEAAALRPDLEEKTWVVEVTENKRLTPLDYDRNVFHMELSTEGTDLTYEVGEALGIHGWNDDEEVREFIRWSGYDADEIVAVPSARDAKRYETRTVFQVLQQKLDIFGKPGKKFYEALGKLATNADEARWLRFISSAEGSSTFKKLSEIETVTYADVLKMFPSARLPFDKLMQEVEEIKPRHYSIASAQAAVGNSVHLLIVTVDWLTPSGSPRYGQCTRYLANLRVGAKVTVSLKPSVMKLPPIDTQPIIMAGLGTGAAPFRAFIQARAHQRAQGKEVGPLIYYFGSRYRASEYLYGGELEAYQDDGVITRMGLAFSRDQRHKIYIQDKIKEDSNMISTWLAPEIDALRRAGGDAQIITPDQFASDEAVPEAQKGYFYLCGPTWPVPSVTEAVLESFQSKGLSPEQAEERLEKLKEQERWVLEVSFARSHLDESSCYVARVNTIAHTHLPGAQ